MGSDPDLTPRLRVRSGSDPRKKRSLSLTGFTLIEILVVFTVIVFLSVFALTNFIDFSATRIEGAAKRIQTDIRYIQQIALAQQRRTRITFDAGTDSYAAEMENTPNAEDWTSINDPLTRQTFQVIFNTGDYQGVDITGVTLGSGDVLIFDEMGDPYTDGNVALVEPANIVLNGTRQIQITRETGRVQIV
ncbi:MAG: hypothetical protein COV74_02720 [Candidatus Omnitrophica bacterium CG11_big_fil_rev_8_21_14_0_20_45_26]|uniref:Type II secretion system protein H n=1 Tax=Candidatus Abzuiibacterium crystallinum TaxID=1974748 RepID=A0A2H0LTY0_9BACT|nr:MAG: hypothetical protein COV74_02720 [Candidatus Omnitrophica bacterium CG11_big_fil_rev_8_21_14_0_20_45_26]PIW65565.1 MAG: hypothetical protein COW12_01200 [Candidatus Omnitrophica bacterium CG12_big_fil_rev_8_21_14_0_65_45_16]